jgi:arylsulfatase A-like enzyme
MLVVCFGIFVATAGALLSFTGGWSLRQSARLIFHVGSIAGATTMLAFVGRPAPRLAACAMGGWLVVLAVVYLGHAIGVRQWGSPMNRAVLIFALRKLPYFARTHARSSIQACLGIIGVFAAGWAAMRFDLPAGESTRTEIYFFATLALIGIAAAIWRMAGLTARNDLVFGLIFDGTGPMAGPPPHDPALGSREAVRVVSPAERRADVILFVVDSLRAQSMSAYGYPRATTPFLDSLVADGARAVPLALASSPSTETALWSVFSSRRARHQAVNAPCLHDMLRAAGYTTRFFLSGSHRDWMGLDALYGTAHDGFVDLLVDEQIVAEAAKLPDATAQGNFFFFHLMSTHGASGREPDPVWTPAANRFAYQVKDIDAAAREHIVNHYDNSVLQADDCIARVLGALRAKGFLRDAVVIVTADHGEALSDRTPIAIGHGKNLFQESIRIPLIVWDSSQTLRAPAALADQTDIAPTILAMLGMESPGAWQGASIWSKPPRRHAHIERVSHSVGRPPKHKECVIAWLPSGIFKSIRYRMQGREILRRAFCLSTDPDEREDLSERLAPEVAAELERIWNEYHAQPALAFSTSWKYLNYKSSPDATQGDRRLIKAA